MRGRTAVPSSRGDGGVGPSGSLLLGTTDCLGFCGGRNARHGVPFAVGDETGVWTVRKERQGAGSLGLTTRRNFLEKEMRWTDEHSLANLGFEGGRSLIARGRNTLIPAASPQSMEFIERCVRGTVPLSIPSCMPLESTSVYQGGKKRPCPSALPFPPSKATPVVWCHTVPKVSRPVMVTVPM